MKKLLLLAVLAVAGIYGTGYVSFSQSGIVRFLDSIEELTLSGKPDELCDLFADDMEVKITDHTSKILNGRTTYIEGGRNEMCDHIQTTVPPMPIPGISTQIERKNIEVKRDWLHPWTAEVSFTEYRSTILGGGRLTIKTESDDRYSLIRTFSGVKIKRLEAESFIQE